MQVIEMTPTQLLREIATTSSHLTNLQARLEHLQRTCVHNWSEVKYTPDVQDGYQTQGDPPGTMGVDRQRPTWVPRSETKKWTRTCATCGKVETTGRTKSEQVYGKVAGTSGIMEVPDFGSRY